MVYHFRLVKQVDKKHVKNWGGGGGGGQFLYLIHCGIMLPSVQAYFQGFSDQDP